MNGQSQKIDYKNLSVSRNCYWSIQSHNYTVNYMQTIKLFILFKYLNFFLSECN